MSAYIIPSVFAFVLIYALIKRVDIFSSFVEGVKEGVQTVGDIFPSLFLLVVAIGCMKASGFSDFLAGLISPLVNAVGFPQECSTLLILRPFSGSGAIAIYETVLSDYGPDSFAGRVASVILGSSETTFYTISVYFAATKIKRTSAALPAALTGDVVGWIVSAVSVKLILGE